MNCEEVQARLVVCWELPENDPERQAIERHMVECDACRAEGSNLDEDWLLNGLPAAEMLPMQQLEHVNRNVMSRIYTEQSWLMPVSERSYAFKGNFRMKAAAIIAVCLSTFVCAFLYFLFGPAGSGQPSTALRPVNGLVETVNASEGLSIVSADFIYNEVPIASISDPVLIHVVPTFPQYWVALSLLGIIMTLLIMNWLSRTRA